MVGPRLERVEVLIIEMAECNILFLFKPSVDQALLWCLIALPLELLRLSPPLSQAAKIPLSSELGIDEFHFNDFSLDNDAMITASLRMFLELGVVQKFKIDYEVRQSPWERGPNANPADWKSEVLLTYVCCVKQGVLGYGLERYCAAGWFLEHGEGLELRCEYHSIHFFSCSGAVPLAANREEELPHRSLPQLEACLQRLAVHVCYDHRKSQMMIEVAWNKWF